ncbi:MAG: SprB repeat-containing protein, partial [Bacteroidia bacterium]|nr:SprB repeat-containing protein [Bacteroidia bacterium]
MRAQNASGGYSQLPVAPLPGGVVSAAWQGAGSAGGPTTTLGGGPAAPMASPPINYDGHIRNAGIACELTVDEEIPGLGFTGGTYGPTSYPGPPGGPANAYVYSHLQAFTFPPAYLQPPFTNAGIAYISGIWVGFSPETRIVGGADQFFIDVYLYNSDLGFGDPIASQPFFLPSNIPTPNITSPTDFQGYLNFLYANAQTFFIPFDTPIFINSEDVFFVGLRVKTPTSNDLISFYYTYGLPGQPCHDTRWRAIFADVNTHQILPFPPGGLPVAYNNYWGGDAAYGNPVIIPKITFEDEPTQDCQLQIVDGQTSDVSCYGFSDGRAFGIQTEGAQGPVQLRVQLLVDANGFDVSGQNIFYNPSAPGVFENLPAGDYRLFATDLGVNCTVEVDFSIGQPQPLGFEANTDASEGTITVNAFGGTPPYQYSISPNVGALNGNVFSGLQPGQYLITVTDANGCSTTDEVLLQDCGNLNFSYSVSSPSGCAYNAPNTLTFIVTGGTPPYTYYVGSSSYSNSVIPGLGQGTETVYVADAVGCESPIRVVTIGPLNANVSTVNPSGGQANGRATILPSGGSPSYQVSITPSNGTEISEGEFVNLPAGQYQVRVTDGNGCIYNTTFTLTEGTQCPPALLPVVTFVNIGNPTPGNSDGRITVRVSGSTAQYSVVLEELLTGITYTQTVGNNQTHEFTGLGAGIYRACATDNNGCVGCSQDVPLDEIATQCYADNIFAMSTCPGQSTGSVSFDIFNGSPPFTITVTGVAQPIFTFDTSVEIPGLSAGSYTVSFTDNAGCQSSFVVIVDEYPPVQVDFQVVCATPGNNNGRISVNTIGTPRLFDQAGNQYFPSEGVFLNLPGQTAFVLRVTASSGCEQVYNITDCLGDPCAGFNVQFSVTSATTGNADGGVTFTITGGGSSYSVYQNGFCGNPNELVAQGASPLSVSGLAAGVYTFCITSNAGCSRIVEVDIPEAQGIELFLNYANNPTSGNNGEISVFAVGGVGVVSYTLYNAQGVPIQTNTTGLFTGLGPGVYRVDATDQSGRTSNEIEVVLQECNLNAVITAQLQACTTARASFQATGGVPPYSYFVNGSFVSSNSTGSFVASNLPLGCNQYLVRDGNGCEVVRTLCVEALTFVFQNIQNPNDGNPGRFEIAIANGSAPYTIFVNNNFQGTTFSPVVPFENLQPGVYNIRIQDAQQCIFEDDIVLSEGCGYVYSTEVTQIGCAGATDGEILFCALGGFVGTLEYSTDNGLNWFSFTAQCENFVNLAEGTYIFLLRD